MSPRGGARPNAGRKARAGVRISKTIRFSDSEWEKVEQYAKEAGCVNNKGEINASEYIRLMALKEYLKR